ncbi:hypothetical protein Tco_0149849 [Tanacetum coccineum]
MLRYYHINLSQLSVIAVAKVSHFEILCCVHGIEPTVGLFRCFYVNSKNEGWMSFSKRSDSDAVCYTKPLDSLKCWNDHFFWVNSFACPASFSWHTGKNVSRDPFPKPTEFRADDYVVLVAHPAPFWKFSEPFLYLIGMSRNYTLDEDTYPTFLRDDGTGGCLDRLFAFIQVADPTKVKVREWERVEDEARLLDSTVRRVVPLLPVSPDRAESELEANVETEIATGDRIVADEDVGDHGASSRAATGGKSLSALRELLASSMLNVEVGVAAVATLPMVTSLVFAKPKHESGVPADSITGLNLRTIGASERFVVSSDSSHHSSTNASGAEGDSIIRSVVVPPVITEVVVTSHAANVPLVPAMGIKVTSPVHASMFHDSDSIETNVLNDSLLDDYDVSREFVEHLAPPALFSQICEMDYHHLFTEFNVGTARQACLNAEVRKRTEYCLIKRKRLESECQKQASLLKAKDEEVENLKARLLLKEAEATEAAHLRTQVSAAEATDKMRTAKIDALKQRNVVLENEKKSLDGKVAELQSSISTKDFELKDLNVAVSSLRSQKDGLVDQVHALEAICFGLRDQVSGYERLKEQSEEFQDVQMNIVNDKVAKLDADLLEMALHLEEKFYPHILTTISALGAAISRAIEKGMQDGLSTVIDHGKAGRSLADVVAYNSAAEANYNSALQRLREVDFPLLAELKSHKNASVENIMNLLRLEGPLADAPRMNDLQPNVDQLMLPVHRSEDRVVLGETSLSFPLSVTHSRVERIREKVAAKRSALIGVWTPLVDPLSVENLVGEAGTSNSMPATVATTTALSTTFAFASSVPPITIEDYEIVGTDGLKDTQENGQGNVASFPTVEFEKEELDTTPERDPRR